MAQVDRPQSGSVRLGLERPADRGWSLDIARSGRLGGAAVRRRPGRRRSAARAGDSRRRLRPARRRELDGQHDRLHRRDGVVGRRLHGHGRRRRADRHGRQPGRGPRRRRQGRLRPGPLARVAGARTCATSTRTATARSWPASSPARTAASPRRTRMLRLGLPRRGARRPDRRRQGRRRRRRHGRQPGHRRDRLGRPAPQRQRPEHPRHQPVVRDELDPGYTVDPLAFAVEQAWKAGIFVVAAAGNYGYQKLQDARRRWPTRPTTRTSSPSARRTPTGTMTHRGRHGRRPSRRAAGEATTRDVDIVAPGAHIAGPARPGLATSIANHAATGAVGDRFFRGSGTSRGGGLRVRRRRAASSSSDPTITPGPGQEAVHRQRGRDRGFAARQQGQGELDLSGPARRASPPALQPGQFAWSTGTGSLEASRGTDHLTQRRRRPRPASRTSSVTPSTRPRWPPSRRTATAGPAARGTATPGPATAGRATPGPATRGPATAGPATRWSGN